MRAVPSLSFPAFLPAVSMLALLAPLPLAGCGDKDGGTQETLTDADGDGFPVEVDCDDDNDAVFPGAPELCNGLDDDCDEDIDEDPAEGPIFYADVDGDGFGNPDYLIIACTQPQGWIDNDQDCNDLSAVSYPDGDEICDGLDNDCDGNIDESPDDAPTWYVDADGDGYGDPAIPVQACSAPDIYVANGDDCNDEDATLSPETIWYGDVDGDGFGGSEFTWVGCEQPDQHTAEDDDCDDRDETINPDAEEVCDDVDNDCDGTIDGADATDAVLFYVDADGDGWGVDGDDTSAGCTAPDGYAADIGDCADDDDQVSPGAVETCGDGVDNNCDGQVDRYCEITLSDADVIVEGVEAGDYSGYRLSTAGDIDGDGNTDLAIGAYGAAGSGDLSGRTFVVFGPVSSGEVISLDDADLTIDGANTNDYSGASVRLGGDATGDGTDDLSIGAWGLDTATSSVGGAYLFSGPISGSLSVDEADFIVAGVTSLDYMGQYVALPGPDITGDGWGDFLVGVAGDDSGGTAAGLIAIFEGPVSGSGDSNDADVRIEGTTSGTYVGYSLASDDIDGDGLDDVLLGGSGQSEAYVLYGPLSGTTTVDDADVTVSSDASDGTGSNVALGDFDGSGGVDLAIGCKYVGTDEMSNVGAWRVLASPLAADLSTDDAVFTVMETSSSEYLGAQYIQVATGDVDGDGADDLLLGGPTNDLAGSTAGAAFLFAGPLSGSVTVQEADLLLYGEASGHAAGYGVDLGDLDGDGSLDAAVGARGWESGAGRVYLVLGPDL